MQIIETTATPVTSVIPSVATTARAKLQSVIERGMANTGGVIRRILSEQPEDSVIAGPALRFEAPGSGQVLVRWGSDESTVHPHAFAQVVQRAGVPKAYADTLAGGEHPWQRALLEHTLREHYGNDDRRFLARRVNGQLRGFLSDSFRRIDSRQLLDAFVGAAQQIGAVPYEGLATDVRSQIRVILPEIVEPVPGEAMVFGLAWNNSDYGASSYGVSSFALRLLCLNGMVGAQELRKVHIGRRLEEDLSFSQATHELDNKTIASATTDAVKLLLGGDTIRRKSEAIRAAHENTDWRQAFSSVSKALTKDEGRKVREHFEGPDVLNLPPGENVWRLSNALSWAANETESVDRKLNLQELAASVVSR